MEGKNEDDYISVFKHVKKVLGFRPDTSMSDYEGAMRNGLKKVFREKIGHKQYRTIRVGGCFFHLSQVIYLVTK